MSPVPACYFAHVYDKITLSTSLLCSYEFYWSSITSLFLHTDFNVYAIILSSACLYNIKIFYIAIKQIAALNKDSIIIKVFSTANDCTL